jgi:cytochrome c-type biogenesis protein CcmH
LSDRLPVLVLTFFAVLSGAGLAFAWYLAVEPVLARIAATRLARAFHSRAALALLLVVPFAAIAAMIATNGKEFLPSLNSATGTARETQLAEARQEAPHDLDQAVKDLVAKLQKSPNDQEGWRLLARSYAELGEPDKAADAAHHAAELGAKPGDAEAESERGEDLVTAAKGVVGPDAREAFRAALATDPSDPRARFFLGLAEAQDGNSDKALDQWLALERDSPPDAPWLDGLRANITRLAQQMGLSAAQLAERRGAPMPAPAATAAAPETAPQAPPAIAAAGGIPGPSAADVAAAQNMSPQDRMQMIQGMVAKLAAEMEQQPKNVDGWLRLGRAYDVLGEKEKSLDAYRRAAAADPTRADAREALARAEATQ